MRRLLPHPLLSLTLFVVWLLLVNEATPGAIAVAVVVALLVPLATSAFWPDRPGLRIGPRLAAYLLIVFWDILVANVQVARLVLFVPARKLRPRFFAVPLELRAPEAISVLAGTITLTPGTVSCDVSGCGRYLLVHGLDVADADETAAAIKRRYEARLKEIFR
jgi:multicomponent K+:H+ antiporter subunit E